MNRASLAAGFAAVAFWSACAWAAENSNRIEGYGNPARAWALVGDFCGIARWHPAIASCTLSEKGGDRTRTLTAKDGSTFVERLVDWNDKGTSYTYAIIESPLPVTDYVSTIRVEDDDEPGKVAITWSSTFKPKGVSEDVARKAVADVYLAGLLKLKSELKKK